MTDEEEVKMVTMDMIKAELDNDGRFFFMHYGPTEFCEGFEDLPITELNFSITQLKKVPKFSKMAKLTSIDIRLCDNNYDAIIDELIMCPMLESVKINADIKAIPARLFSGLQTVKTLDFAFSKTLRVIPDEISLLQALETLHFTSCKLKSYPETLANMPNLTRLDFHDNEWDKLPAVVTRMTQLKELNINDNPISTLPPEIGNLTKLEKLSLRKCKLIELPDELAQCTEINDLTLNDAGMTHFPEVICKLKKLTNLNVSGNHFDEIPPSIGNLQKLSFFDISENRISRVPFELAELPEVSLYTGNGTEEPYKFQLVVYQKNLESELEDYETLKKKARRVAMALKEHDKKNATRRFAESVEYARKKSLTLYFSVMEVERKLTRMWYASRHVWWREPPTRREKLNSLVHYYWWDGTPPLFIFYGQFALYIIFLALFTSAVLTNTTTNSLSFGWTTNGIKNAFSLDEFNGMTTTDDFWNWANGPFLDTLYGGTIGRDGQRFGIPIIRQLRVQGESCKSEKTFKDLVGNQTCFYDYGSTHEERADFVKNNITYKYTHASQYFYVSPLGFIYPNGGYSVPLGNQQSSAQTALARLQSTSWIDDQTRAVFIDVTVYSVNSDVVSTLLFAVEMPQSGSLAASTEFKTFSLYPYKVDGTLIVMLIIYFSFIIVEVYEIIRLARSDEKVYTHFLDLWNFFEISCYILSFVVFVMNLASYTKVHDLPFDFENNSTPSTPNQYGQFYAFGFGRDTELTLLTVVSIIYYILLFKYLQIIEVVGVLFVIMIKMVQQLALFILVYIVILLGFSLGLTLQYGSQLLDFRSFGFSIVSLLRMPLGDLSFDDFVNQNQRFAFAVVVIYAIIGIILLLNLLIAMLNDAYSVMKHAKDQYLLMKANLIASYRPIVKTKEKYLRRKDEDEDDDEPKKPTDSVAEVPKEEPEQELEKKTPFKEEPVEESTHDSEQIELKVVTEDQ